MGGITPPRTQAPGVFHRKIGDITLTVLNDGEVPGTVLPLEGVGSVAIAAVATRKSDWLSVNAFAVHSRDRLALIDAGGNKLRPTTGLLMQNMAFAGLSPGDFDTVLLTHMHPDHVGWLIDDDGKPLFPNSRIVMAEIEHDFWADERNRAKVTPRDPPWHDQNVAVLKAYRGQIDTFTSGEVFPGITSVDLPGHTPGHTGYEVSSAGQSVLLWGDLIQNPELQTRFPAAQVPWDVDPAQAVKSRVDLFERLIAEGNRVVAGTHLPFPSLCTLVRASVGYDLIPEVWTPYIR